MGSLGGRHGATLAPGGDTRLPSSGQAQMERADRSRPHRIEATWAFEVTARSLDDFGDSTRHTDLREPSPVGSRPSRQPRGPGIGALGSPSEIPVVQNWESVKSSVSIASAWVTFPLAFRKLISPSTAKYQDEGAVSPS